MVIDISKESMPLIVSLDFLTMNNTILPFEKSVNINQSIRRNIPEDLNSSAVNDLRQADRGYIYLSYSCQ
jgi:hypothetical protein